MSPTNPTWQRHDWRRFVRNDAHLFIKPEPIPRKSYAERLVEQRRAEEERSEFDAKLKVLSAHHLDLRHELAELKFYVAWRRLCRKYGYNPDQPRDERGRWVDAGGEADGISADTGGDANSTNGTNVVDGNESTGDSPVVDDDRGVGNSGDKLTQVLRICMAGSSSVSTDRWGNQSYWVEYVCADGFVFKRSGSGGRFGAFARDPRF